MGWLIGIVYPVPGCDTADGANGANIGFTGDIDGCWILELNPLPTRWITVLPRSSLAGTK